MLTLSLGKLPIPFMTITENVETYLEYPEELRLFTQVPHYIRKALRSLYRSVYQLILQSKQLRGDSQRMLMKIVQNEVGRFYEQVRYQLFEIDTKFEGFGKRLQRFVKDHI